MKKPPRARQIHPGVYGRVLLGALLFKLEVRNASTRRGDNSGCQCIRHQAQ